MLLCISRERCLLTYLVLCFGSVCHSQYSEWIYRQWDGKRTDESFSETETFPLTFGPQLPSKCELRQDILDQMKIRSMRTEINQCNFINISCEGAANSKYRTLDGSCNNLKHPSFGKSNTCLVRGLPFDYSDNISAPRESASGKPLPNARHLSNVFHAEIQPLFGNFTTFFLSWGQMFAHDVTLNPEFVEAGSNDDEIDCCKSGPLVDDRCISIAIPPNDPFYSKAGLTCLNVKRTIPCECYSLGKRAHLNKNTAFQDLSLVYGSTEEDSLKLRSFINGRLLVQYNPMTGDMPPSGPIEDLCHSTEKENYCYISGDRRANQNPLILTAHTYLLRNHNNICEELYKIHNDWDDETLFQEARRIHIAQAQFITFGFYIPWVLGEIADDLGVRVLTNLNSTKYDPEMNPSMSDEYASVAARYGHTLIPGHLSQIDPDTGITSGILLRNYYFTPKGFKYGQYERTLKGMLVDTISKEDLFLGDDVRNFLYRRLYRNRTIGGDLASLSILRAREHGIPGYTHYQALMGNIINSFEDLTQYMPKNSVDLMKKEYECVHDIDFYVAGLAEYLVPGGLVGQTFATILGEQYKKMKFGDRYWFEHRDQAGSFTPEQVQEIKKTSLSRIICDTSNIKEVQEFVFRVASEKNPIIHCNQFEKMDFSVF